MTRRLSSPRTIGRDTELTTIDGVLDAAATGDGRVLLISGEAGLGKSRLVTEIQRRATERGALTLLGATPVSGAAEIPFAPIVDALRSLSRRVSEPELTALLGPARVDLARLVPSLAPEIDWAARDADADPVPGGWARTRLFEGIAGVLERLGEWRPPAVLVVEDLHWADRSSVDAFAFLARVLGDARVVLAGTLRIGDTDAPNEGVRRTIEELSRQDGVEHLRLGRLADAEIAALVSELLGHRPDDATLDALLRRAGGVPFYAEELAASDDETGLLPPTLEGVVRARFDGLDEQARDVLRLAATIGERVEYPLLRAAAGDVDEASLERALREAISRHILLPESGPWGFGFRFRHELLRESLESEMLPGRRAASHAAVAEAVHGGALGSATPQGNAARLARHWIAAGDWPRALPALVEAGGAAEAAMAFPEAATHFRAALVAWDRVAASAPGQPAEVAGQTHLQLVRRAAEVAALTGSMDDATRLATVAVDAAEGRGDKEQTAQARERLGRFLWLADARERSLEAFASAAAAAEAIPGSATQARVLASQARALALSGSAELARDVALRALAAARSSESHESEAAASHGLGLALSALGDDDGALEAFAAARRADGLAGRETVPPPSRILSLVDQYADLAEMFGRAGRVTESDEAARRGQSMVERMGLPSAAGARLAVERADRLFRAGDWDDAERVTRELLAASVPTPSRRVALVVRARLATGRGRYAEAAELLAAMHPDGDAGDSESSVEAWIAAVELALWRDRLDDARLALHAGRQAYRRGDDPALGLELLALGLRLEGDRAELARIRRSVADRVEAVSEGEALAAEARSSAARAGSRLAPLSIALVRVVEAEHGRTLGTSDGLAWIAAADAWDRAGCPWPSAYARWQAAESFAADRGRRDEARTAVTRAIDTVRALGAAPLEERLTSLARRARIDLPSRDGNEAPPEAPERETLGLSPRELEVLELVADGRTNRQIAEALFITEKTAGHHVSNLMGKLGVASRVEAAALAHRAGLAGDERA